MPCVQILRGRRDNEPKNINKLSAYFSTRMTRKDFPFYLFFDIRVCLTF